jgi:hypothetical protein
MATQAGRMEKRIQLEMPVHVSRMQSLGLSDFVEKATTENVSSGGIRVLIRRALLPDERLRITLLVGSERSTPARVVYCQPIAGALFGLGLQFEEETTWSRGVVDTPN